MSKEDKNIYITSHNQSGGVTAQTVNFGPLARQMNQQLGDQLRQNIPTSAAIKVIAVLGDGEAFGFANQVLQWLKSNGFSKAEGVDQALYTQPVIGQRIDKNAVDEFKVIIGIRE
ncbi:MAG: hypothetical protein WCO02_18810 [Bacteroidota bacterium]